MGFPYSFPFSLGVPPTLIETAIANCKAYREQRNALNLGLQYPTSPRAYVETFYLTLREDIMRASAKTSKTVSEPLKRTYAYQILTQALIDIFQYGYTPNIVKPYNDLLDKTIGYH